MKNTHKHFWTIALSHAERRLIGKAEKPAAAPAGAPEPMPGEKEGPEAEAERRESARKNREKNRHCWEEVEDRLGQVVHRVARGNKKREDLLRDPLIRRLIMAQVRLEAGNNVRWLPDTLLETAKYWHPAFENADEELDELKGDMHDEVIDLFDSMESIVKWLDAALKDYEVRIDENRELVRKIKEELKENPDLDEEIKKAKETEKEILLERIKVQENARNIVKNARDVLERRIKSQEETIRHQETLLDEARDVIDTPDDELSPAKKKKALDDIRKRAKLGFTEAEPKKRKKVEAALKEITDRIAALDLAQDLLLKDNFHERREYLLRFGGFTAELLLAQAQVTDGVYDPDLLAIDLKILGYDFDIDELERYKNNKEELLKYLTSKRSETSVYKNGGVEVKGNSAGIPLRDIYLNSQLPQDVLEALEDGNFKKDIDVSVLFAMAKVEDTRDLEDTFKRFFETDVFTKKEDIASGATEIRLDKKEFIDTLAFMFFEGNAEEARKKAEDVFTKLKTKGELFTVTGAGRIVLKDAIDANAFIVAIQAESPGFGFSEGSEKLIQSMRAANVHEKTIPSKVKDFGAQTVREVAGATPIWWEWITSLPRNVWAPGLDEELLKILNQRRALSHMQKAIISGTTVMQDSETFFTEALRRLEDNQASVRAATGSLGIATDARRHLEGARHLSEANVHFIERLSNEYDWESQPLVVRQISLWLVAFKGKGGYALAGEFISGAASKSGKAMNDYITEYVNDRDRLSEEDQKALLTYIDSMNEVEVIQGQDILLEAKNRGIRLKPMALDILVHKDLAGTIGRWTIDDPNKVARPALTAILTGPGAAKMIEAFVTKKDQTYDLNGVTQTITPADATMYVKDIEERLKYLSRQQEAAQEQMGKDELMKDPIGRALRSGADALRDMWSGDWVNKGAVIAAVLVGVWALWKAWKEGGKEDTSLWKKLTRFGMIAAPLALVGNHMYKKSTGKDFLGEKLSWMSGAKRGTAIEQARRAGAEGHEKFRKFGANAQHAAMRQMMDRESPISIQELLAWRNTVKGKGHVDFSEGAPDAINTFDIMDSLGEDAEESDAYEVVYYAFEALCVTVASLKKIGGSTDSKVEAGLDIIKRKYVDLEDLTPEQKKDFAGRKITMMDVIIYESRTPEIGQQILQDRSFLEWLGSATGLGYEKVRSLVARGWTTVEIWGEKVGEKVPDYYETGKEWTLDTADSIWNWGRVTYAKLGKEVPENFVATWKFVVDTGKEIGMQVVTHGPGAVEFVFKKGFAIGARGYKEIKDIHDYMLTNPTLHAYVKSFEDAIWRVFGIEIGELAEEQAGSQFQHELEAIVSFYSGGNYPIMDVRRKGSTLSAYMPLKRTEKLSFADPDTGKEILPEDARTQIIEWADDFLSERKPFEGGEHAGKTFLDLPPALRRYVLEVVNANIYANIVSNSEFKNKIDDYKTSLADLKKEVSDSEIELQSKQDALDDLNTDLNEWNRIEERLEKIPTEKAQLQIDRNRETDPDKQLELDAKIQAKRLEESNILDAIDEFVADYNTIAQLKAQIQTAELARDAAQTNLSDKTNEYNLAKRKGPGEASVQFGDDLIDVSETDKTKPNYFDGQILTAAASERIKDLFDNPDASVVFENRTWLLRWALSTTRAIGESGLQDWKEDRINNDPEYKNLQSKEKKTTEEIAALGAYERYLDGIAYTEVFHRTMMASLNPDSTEENEAILHLSVDEAKYVIQYLEEREGLVTFKKFYETYKALAPAYRP